VTNTRRVNRGRGHSYLLDGDRADGVTWIVSNGVPKPALVGWAARESAGYAIDHWDELAGLGAADRMRRIEAARFESSKRGAVRGTDVHQLALKLAQGQEVEVPDHLEGHVDAYLRFVNEWEPKEVLTEVVVGNRQYRYMGTLDTVAELADGNTWLLDWKTTQSGIWPESALQLAAYRNAEFYLGGEAHEVPFPRIQHTGCVWLKPDSYELVPVNTQPEVFRTFLYAQQVARFTSEPREMFVLPTLEPPAKEEAA